MAHKINDGKTYRVTQCQGLQDKLCHFENGGHGSIRAVCPLEQTEVVSSQNPAARDLRSIPVDLSDSQVERKAEGKKITQ